MKTPLHVVSFLVLILFSVSSLCSLHNVDRVEFVRLSLQEVNIGSSTPSGASFIPASLSSSPLLSSSPRRMSVQFEAFNKELVLDVTHNTALFDKNYKEAMFDENGEVISTKRGVAECLFTGHVRGDADSRVVLTACDGVVHGHLHSPLHALRLNVEPRHMHEGSRNSEVREAFDRHHQRHRESSSLLFGHQEFTHVVFETPDADATHSCGVRDKTTFPSQHHGVQFKAQQTGECDTNPTKYVGVLIVNEYNHYLARGDQVESFAAQVFAVVAAYYVNANFDCVVSPYMVGMVTYTKANPSAITTRFCSTVDTMLTNAWSPTHPCCASEQLNGCPNGISYCLRSVADGLDINNPGCWNTNNVESVLLQKTRIDISVVSLSSNAYNEIDQTQLLDSFSRWSRVNQVTALANLFSPFANAQLLTYLKFEGYTVGLGTVGTVCGTRSAAIESAMYDSAFYVGSVQAHELGHNFNMQHDTQPGYVMYASGNTQNVPVTFSSESRNYILTYFNDMYGDNGPGQPGNPRCLPVDAPTYESWTSTLCGNGRVDPNEDCDVGFGVIDACCTSDCHYAPGCACVTSQPCCNNGVIRSSSTVCRTSKGASCDYVEYCNGLSGACPPDTFVANGVNCIDQYNSVGRCYRGVCQSRDTQCAVEWGGSLQFAGCAPNACTRTMCSSVGGATGGCQTKNAPAPDGMPCGSANGPVSQCVNQNCTLSSSLHQFVWVDGAWLACEPNGQQLRSRTCQDETGTLANTTTLCPNIPPNNRSCACSGQPLEVGGVNYVIPLSCTGALLPNKNCSLTCQAPEYVPSGEMVVNCTNGVYSHLRHYCNVAGQSLSTAAVVVTLVFRTNRLQLSDLTLVSQFFGDMAVDLHNKLGIPFARMAFMSVTVFMQQNDMRTLSLAFIPAQGGAGSSAQTLASTFSDSVDQFCLGGTNPVFSDWSATTTVLRLIVCAVPRAVVNDTVVLSATTCSQQGTWRPFTNPTPCGSPTPPPPEPASAPAWLAIAVGCVAGAAIIMCALYASLRHVRRRTKADQDISKPGMQMEGVQSSGRAWPQTKWNCPRCTLEQVGGGACQACGQRRQSLQLQQQPQQQPIVMVLGEPDAQGVRLVGQASAGRARGDSAAPSPPGGAHMRAPSNAAPSPPGGAHMRAPSNAVGVAHGRGPSLAMGMPHPGGAVPVPAAHARAPSVAPGRDRQPSAPPQASLMAGPGPAGPAAVTGQWRCPQCTLDNSMAAYSCGACGGARPTITTPPPIVEEPMVVFVDR